MKHTIISVGGRHDADIAQRISRYEKRLAQIAPIEWQLLPHAKGSESEVRQRESEQIRQRLKAGSFVILLDERGQEYDSPGLAAVIEKAARDITWIIGGAYGVDETLLDQADVVLSLSKMIFPHQLVRAMLVEQIYRCEMIRRGHPYHHG